MTPRISRDLIVAYYNLAALEGNSALAAAYGSDP